jgi:hypothetical protein
VPHLQARVGSRSNVHRAVTVGAPAGVTNETALAIARRGDASRMKTFVFVDIFVYEKLAPT